MTRDAATARSQYVDEEQTDAECLAGALVLEDSTRFTKQMIIEHLQTFAFEELHLENAIRLNELVNALRCIHVDREEDAKSRNRARAFIKLFEGLDDAIHMIYPSSSRRERE